MNAAVTLRASGGEAIRSSWIRYGAVVAGLVLVLATTVFVAWPWLYEEAVLRVFLPQYESEFGFHGGWIRPVDFEYSVYGIASVVPGGRLERAGVKAGDLPVYGPVALYDALEDVHAGRPGRFRVVADVRDWRRDRDLAREIRLAPK